MSLQAGLFITVIQTEILHETRHVEFIETD